MKNFMKNNPMLPTYIVSSLIGNITIYCIFSWATFSFKDFLLTLLGTIVSFIFGYFLLTAILFINKIEKESYEYRKKHPTEDEPW